MERYSGVSVEHIAALKVAGTRDPDSLARDFLELMGVDEDEKPRLYSRAVDKITPLFEHGLTVESLKRAGRAIREGIDDETAEKLIEELELG